MNMFDKKRNAWPSALVIFCLLSISLAASQQHSFVPEDGFVPDKQTAIKIAEAIWIPIYGEKTIKHEKPFRAILHDDRWIVTGTLPKDVTGGVAVAEISKSDGRILRVSHGK